MSKKQVEKFNARLAKARNDEETIARYKAKQAMDESSRYGSISGESVDDLKAKGSIEEAAAVFTQEGLSTFAKMFGNSVENILSDRMDKFERKMESIIEDKMLQMLDGMTKGIQEFSNQSNMSIIIPDPEVATKSIPQKQDKPEEKTTQPKAKRRKRKPNNYTYIKLITPGYNGLKPMKEGTTLGSSRDDINMVVPYFMGILESHSGENLKSVDVVRTLENDFNIHLKNPTHVWNYLLEYDANVVKVAHGTYKYEEKSFPPTI